MVGCSSVLITIDLKWDIEYKRNQLIPDVKVSDDILGALIIVPCDSEIIV